MMNYANIVRSLQWPRFSYFSLALLLTTPGRQSILEWETQPAQRT